MAITQGAYARLAAENDRLRQENAVLRTYLSEDLLRRIAIENGWPHEPNNPLGHWCCDEHQEAFRAGTLFAGAEAEKGEANG